jgi:hypothetical protein
MDITVKTCKTPCIEVTVKILPFKSIKIGLNFIIKEYNSIIGV